MAVLYCDMVIELGNKHVIGKRGEGDVTLAFSQRFNLSFFGRVWYPLVGLQFTSSLGGAIVVSYCDMIIEFDIKHIIGKRGEGDVTLAFSQRFNLSFSEKCDTLLSAYNSLLP